MTKDGFPPEPVLDTIGGGNDKICMSKFYITTPIYYINDKPHIGHAYTTIAADVLARYHRMRGSEVFYLVGTDENSQKNSDAAIAAGESDISKYIATMSEVWRKTWRTLAISNDDFIRTTEKRHHVAVEKFWHIVKAKGDIYKGNYEGWYCTACEAYYLENDVGAEHLCPTHKKTVEWLSEENYFFKLTKYRDALLDHINKNPDFIQPESRKNEIVNYIRDHMTDVSISRQKGACGIPVPGDSEHKIYVWFDALINYLSAIGYGTNEKEFSKWWPADLHLVGKDIIKFHCALWPAMLMSADLPLPKSIFAHGYFTIDGAKMSKTAGNVISPLEVTEKYGNDALRYFLLREMTFGEDGDFSLERLNNRYEKELSNELGNLVHRTLSMTEKYAESSWPKVKQFSVVPQWDAYYKAMATCSFYEALSCVWDLVRQCNKLIDEKKPWSLVKKDEAATKELLGGLLETLRHIALQLHPFMPETAAAILIQLGVEIESKKVSFKEMSAWGIISKGAKIKKSSPIFKKI